MNGKNRIIQYLWLGLCLVVQNTWAQPNIILIISDDLGVDATNGYHTNSLMPNTPTLDSLMRNGITFENAWAYPVCTPTRSTIMSGKYGIKTNVMSVPGNLDTSHKSVFKELKDLSKPYAGAVIGKWHISNPSNPLHPSQHGVDYYMGFLSGFPADYYSWDKTQNGITTNENNYVTSTITDSAIKWISSQTQPWFLWLAHAAPHTPLHLPPGHMYTISPTNSNIRKYFAMIESMDYELNRLIYSMSQVERDNTLIIYIGDNGTPGNLLRDYPNGHGKGSLYQGGIRVPMIVAGAGVTRKGEQESALVNVNDIFATILEVAGDTLHGGLHNSWSFKHLLNNSNGERRDYNYVDYKNGTSSGYAIRNQRYKLIEYPLGTQEFYDLVADSLEFIDLLEGNLTSDQQAVKQDLEAEAAQIRTAWSCRDYVKNGDEDSVDCGGTYCDPCTTMNLPMLDNSEVAVYPNPMRGGTYIDAKGRNIQSVQVFDPVGRRVMMIDSKETHLQQLDLSQLKSSYYLIEITLKEGVVYKKVFKD